MLARLGSGSRRLDLFQGGRAAPRVIAVAGGESGVRPAGFAGAACELLIATCWPHRDDLRPFITTGVSISDGTSPMAAVDWVGAISADFHAASSALG